MTPADIATSASTPDPELLTAATEWLEADPDPATRAELEALLSAVGSRETGAYEDLVDRFAGTLQFGTAGLRGRLGAGPNRMNRAVVIRAAAGLTTYLLERSSSRGPRVVVGYDARHSSDVFALDTAAVVTAAGGTALVLPEPLPTPVLAFLVRHLNADAGVMVTASHNPAEDNGYKVYLGDGSQIVPPADAEIAALIEAAPPVPDIGRASDGWTVLGHESVEAYLDAAVAVLDPHTSRELRIVHTSLHGVGHDLVTAAFARAGFPPLQVVSEQADPDPDFPTVSFPNPEEPGAIDSLLALAVAADADLAIANDPDADRCAVAVPGPQGWRMLRGDEVGTLLGWHMLRRGRRGTFASSIVSSRMLGALATAHGVQHVETLTGFKWISRAPGLDYGYEEALGYCVDPVAVADKDGITAALMVAELAAEQAARGRTLLDALDHIETKHGVYATDAFSVRVADLAVIPELMERLRSAPPRTLGGVPVSRMEDLSLGIPAAGSQPALPPTDGLRWYAEDGTRVIARPSGTEPKLKVYCEVVVPVTGDLGSARSQAAARLAAVRADMEQLTRA